MADELDPPRKFYELKPRAFETVNKPLRAAPPGGVPLPPTQGAKIEVQDLYNQAQTPGPILTLGRTIGSENEVNTILKDNLAHANAAGLNTLTFKRKRRSRRTRDYFLVVIPLNAFFAFVAFGPYSNAAVLMYGFAGIILSTVGLTGGMFFVMDEY